MYHYLKPHANTPTESLRTILQEIRVKGLNNFSVSVCTLPLHLQSQQLLLALEQYYILSMNPVNNSLLVVGTSPGGSWLSQINSATNSVPISMYLNGALIYVFNSMVGMTNSAVSILRIKTNTLIDRLDTGLLLWDQFTVTRGMPTPEELENSNIHQLEDLLALIAKAKEAYKNHMYVSLLDDLNPLHLQ